MRVWRLCGALWRRFPALLAGAVALLVVQSLIGIASFCTLAPVIDILMRPDLEEASPITRQIVGLLRAAGLPVTLVTLLAVFLACDILKNGVAIFVQYWLLKTRLAVLRDLTVGSFTEFFSARWGLFSSNRQGVLINTLGRELTIVGDAFGQLAMLCSSAIQCLVYVALPLALSWRVTAISMAAALLLASPFLLWGKLAYRLGQAGTATANTLGTVIQEHLGMAKVILGFGHQAQSISRLAGAFDAHARVTLKARTLTLSTPLLYEPLGTLVLILAVVAANRMAVPLSTTAVILWTLRNMVPLVGAIATQRNAVLNFVPSYEQVQRARAEAHALRQASGSRLFLGFEREMAVEGLSFAYAGHAPVLAGVDLVIPRGKMVALVGGSGEGKTSLIDLLLRFHEPSAGRITVDGVPLQEFDIQSYRSRIGYVPQESVLFNASIRDNLRWAKDDATEDEIRAACRQAHAEEFIERFPEGYETVVGDRGVRLSGGQCQRVALARAILRRPALFLLDEATSALDTQSERLIQRAIEAVAKDTTVIMVAHRLSTIVNADYVYVLRQGRIIEEGTYHALVEQRGVFHRMTQLQVLEPVA